MVITVAVTMVVTMGTTAVTMDTTVVIMAVTMDTTAAIITVIITVTSSMDVPAGFMGIATGGAADGTAGMTPVGTARAGTSAAPTGKHHGVASGNTPLAQLRPRSTSSISLLLAAAGSPPARAADLSGLAGRADLQSFVGGIPTTPRRRPERDSALRGHAEVGCQQILHAVVHGARARGSRSIAANSPPKRWASPGQRAER